MSSEAPLDPLPVVNTPPYKIVILSGIQQLLDSSTHRPAYAKRYGRAKEGSRGGPCIRLVALCPSPAVIYAIRAHEAGGQLDPWNPQLTRDPSPTWSTPNAHFKASVNKTGAQDDDFIEVCFAEGNHLSEGVFCFPGQLFVWGAPILRNDGMRKSRAA